MKFHLYKHRTAAHVKVPLATPEIIEFNESIGRPFSVEQHDDQSLVLANQNTSETSSSSPPIHQQRDSSIDTSSDETKDTSLVLQNLNAPTNNKNADRKTKRVRTKQNDATNLMSAKTNETKKPFSAAASDDEEKRRPDEQYQKKKTSAEFQTSEKSFHRPDVDRLGHRFPDGRQGLDEDEHRHRAFVLVERRHFQRGRFERGRSDEGQQKHVDRRIRRTTNGQLDPSAIATFCSSAARQKRFENAFAGRCYGHGHLGLFTSDAVVQSDDDVDTGEFSRQRLAAVIRGEFPPPPSAPSSDTESLRPIETNGRSVVHREMHRVHRRVRFGRRRTLPGLGLQKSSRSRD